MKLEQQVCSLELSKRLRELGVKQESLFWWVHGHGRYELYDKRINQDGNFSAFTVAELGEMLPAYIYGDAKKQWTLHFAKYAMEWEVWYQSFGVRVPQDWIHNQYGTEPDARAKMLAYLLENKLITL